MKRESKTKATKEFSDDSTIHTRNAWAEESNYNAKRKAITTPTEADSAGEKTPV